MVPISTLPYLKLACSWPWQHASAALDACPAQIPLLPLDHRCEGACWHWQGFSSTQPGATCTYVRPPWSWCTCGKRCFFMVFIVSCNDKTFFRGGPPPISSTHNKCTAEIYNVFYHSNKKGRSASNVVMKSKLIFLETCWLCCQVTEREHAPSQPRTASGAWQGSNKRSSK